MKKFYTIAITASIFCVGCGNETKSSAVSLKGSTSTSGLAATSASLFKLKVYKAAVSTSPLCTNLITIYESSNPDYTSFDGNSFGQASVPNGTYNCIAFEVSDIIKFVPSANDLPGCVQGTEYSREVCRADQPSTIQYIDGTTDTCSNGEQRMAIYISTASSSTGGGGSANPFVPPTTSGAASDSTHGMKLNGVFQVSGSTTGTFIVDSNGGVANDSGDCDMQPPQWGFQ